MSMISERAKELRYKADIYNTVGSVWELNRAEAKILQGLLRQAADTIESLSAKLQAANMERSVEDCGGWIPCKNRLPETSEYMGFGPNPYMKRLEIAYMTDMVEYTIGYFDGYKWIDKRNRKIENVIAWKPFVKLPEQMQKESETGAGVGRI